MTRPYVLLLLPLTGFIIAGCSHPVTAQAGDSSQAVRPDSKGALTKLIVKDVKTGDGGQFGLNHASANGDMLYVLYTGKLANGTVFDSNESGGKKAFAFPLGEGQVVKGWDEGLLGMKVGGERELSIPASLAYGDKGMGSAVPPNSDLYFDVKLLDMVPSGEESDVTPDDIKVGTGPQIKKGDKVTIAYTITDIQQNVLDSRSGVSWKFGNPEQAYPALEMGMEGMRQGGTRLIHIGPAVMMRAGGKRALMEQASVQIVKVELTKVQPSA